MKTLQQQNLVGRLKAIVKYRGYQIYVKSLEWENQHGYFENYQEYIIFERILNSAKNRLKQYQKEILLSIFIILLINYFTGNALNTLLSRYNFGFLTYHPYELGQLFNVPEI